MLSKRYYIKFADMIAEYKEECASAINESEFLDGKIRAINEIQSDMIAILQSDNPSFDADRFNQYIDNKVKSLSIQ